MSASYLPFLSNSHCTRTISITSGKGGVGKSSLTANLARYLGLQGKRVLIFDADLGMANIDIMFGVRTQKSIADVMKGQIRLKDVIVSVLPNIDLIPGGSGVYELQNLNAFERQFLLSQISELDVAYDYLLIDTAPGISDNVLTLNAAAQQIVVVVTPDPSSIADAYALMKVLHLKYREQKFTIVCNNVKNEGEGLAIYRRLSDVAQQFLCISLDYLGYIPRDMELMMATRHQRLVLDTSRLAPSSRSIQLIGQKLPGMYQDETVKGGVQLFLRQLVGATSPS